MTIIRAHPLLLFTCSPLLHPAGSRLDAAAGAGGGKACSHAAAALAHALQTDSNAATARLHDGSRALLQVVWLTAVPRQTLEELL